MVNSTRIPGWNSLERRIQLAVAVVKVEPHLGQSDEFLSHTRLEYRPMFAAVGSGGIPPSVSALSQCTFDGTHARNQAHGCALWCCSICNTYTPGGSRRIRAAARSTTARPNSLDWEPKA
eukprot:gb/GECG01006363.1/.p1 GENE.gb/GECG01006363.1/~~gb/GECG01006363.1/.p1  ORF type:complete len:120 (+),score=3.97 gb/GECG01006363.1/:1-360(+)